MSDYVREKVIRFKPSDEQFQAFRKKYGIDGFYDAECVPELETLFSPRQRTHIFEPAPTEENYLDFVLEYSYGEDEGDWGKVRNLLPSEQAAAIKLFQKVIPDATAWNMRVVEFCWYNCSEAPGYFELEDDLFYKSCEKEIYPWYEE